MLKANSLLYAIYICLIVALLCGALIYIGSLYGRLNLYYNSSENLYIHNQSYLNYALSSPPVLHVDENGIEDDIVIKPYGLLKLITARSSITTDTVTSVHFAGVAQKPDVAFYMANSGFPLYYWGNVTIAGKKVLPKTYIGSSYIDNKPNRLIANGETSVSGPELPQLPENCMKGFYPENFTIRSAAQLAMDSVNFNSFAKPVQKIRCSGTLRNITIKGNIILEVVDSLYIAQSCKLNDVLIVGPKVIFEKDFRGVVQVKAETVVLEDDVTLRYPSAIVAESSKGEIEIGKGCTVGGLIVLLGTNRDRCRDARLFIDESCIIAADIYCAGNLILKSNVYGSVYTNLISYKRGETIYENLIAEVEINPERRSKLFVGFPINEPRHYALIKKVL
ncbi:hypothetical protein VF13_39830 [Nostoc linckia z16]|nr:hypothetical protein VF13_39830 [Nostoc linckia z16]